MIAGFPAVSLADLPDACIVIVLLFLHVRDALQCRRTCRRLNLLVQQSQSDFWLPRLRREFGLPLQVCHLGLAATRASQQRLAGVLHKRFVLQTHPTNCGFVDLKVDLWFPE